MTIPFLCLILLNVADILLTNYIIKTGGREGNPILRPLVEKFGPIPGLLLFKLPILVLVYSFFSTDDFFIWILCIPFAAAVVWNCSQILKFKRG